MKPTRVQLEEARDKTVADVIVPDLSVVFCGINPGLYTAAVGHHYAHPGNRFWRALFRGGFTPRLFAPEEERELLPLGYGLTNLVPRTTATAAEVGNGEFRTGARVLEEKILRYRPCFLAFVGIGAYRIGFGRPKAVLGPQNETIGSTRIWTLPSTSGLNQNYPPVKLAALFRQLKDATG